MKKEQNGEEMLAERREKETEHVQICKNNK
jgi:hypothetical protein